MLNCPHCNQLINSNVVTCPHCRTVLKAYGHPGITLHRAIGDTPLCESCTYHVDDTCTFPQRPYAKECTLYNDSSQSQLEQKPIYIPRRNLLQLVKRWYQQNPAVLGVLGLLAVSFLVTLIATSK